MVALPPEATAGFAWTIPKNELTGSGPWSATLTYAGTIDGTSTCPGGETISFSAAGTTDAVAFLGTGDETTCPLTSDSDLAILVADNSDDEEDASDFNFLIDPDGLQTKSGWKPDSLRLTLSATLLKANSSRTE